MSPAVLAHRAICTHCGRANSRRRGLCWSCYRKFRETAQQMPPREFSPGRPSEFDGIEAFGKRLEAWVRSLSPEARSIVRAALDAID